MSSTTWSGDIELSGDGTVEVEEELKLILAGTVDVSSANLNAYGSLDITGILTGSGNLNSITGITDISACTDSTAFTGTVNVKIGATVNVSTVSVVNATEINLEGVQGTVSTGATLNIVQADVVPFAAFTSFALPTKPALTKVGLGGKISLKNKLI
jgi:hypothetical protein